MTTEETKGQTENSSTTIPDVAAGPPLKDPKKTEGSDLFEALKDLPKEPEKTAVEWWQFIQDIVDKLTLKKILLVLIAGVILIAATLFYENRNIIFSAGVDAINNNSSTPTSWTVSEETKSQLTALVRNSPLIKAALITEVDLQKNRRIPRWWFLEDEQETQIRMKAASLLAQPVFDYDPKNTQQMVSVLNNEFSCVPYTDTIYQRLFPDLGPRMPTVCRLAIPPFYGRFAGILTFGLEVVPSKAEQDSIRLEASRIAVEIYLRDVVKKPVPGTSPDPK